MNMNKNAMAFTQNDSCRWPDSCRFFKEFTINLTQILGISITAVDTKIEIPPSGPGSVDAARPQKVAWFPLREAKFPYRDIGSPGRTRTSDKLINSQPLYQLSYRGTALNGSGILREGLI